MKEKIIALGFFDGVHLGHQALLKTCRELADQQACRTAAITFSSHPDTLVLGMTPPLIHTIEDRVALLKSFGIEEVKVLPFDQKMQTMPWKTFLDDLVNQGAAGFVCGRDFRFGNRGEGNAEMLKAYCAERELLCSIVEDRTLDGIRVSSTYIRDLLEAGKLDKAVRFMGHPHILTGQVVSGRKIGRTIGVPTANLLLPEGVVALPHGVYACKALADGKEYLAVTNIGSRPTVGGHQARAEAWLLDFDGDLYGKALTLQFYRFLRPEQKFDALEELQAEIQKNAGQTRKIFEKR